MNLLKQNNQDVIEKYILLAAVLASINCGNPASAENLPTANGLKHATQQSMPASAERITGPFTSANLSVYLIHGKDTSKFQNFLTLQEAMTKAQVVVKETGDVNQLAIQNNGVLPIFVQSGDIVKGGRQDRTMQYDMILPPKSGMVPINSFCVEHGRWSQRGAEDAGAFGASQFQLVNKSMKMAAKYDGDQQKVWNLVDRFKSVGYAKAAVSPAQAMASPSPSSLEMALENDKVKQSTQKYVQDLQNIVDNKNDVVGYAFAINGKVNSVDVYANNALFKKMWPKLINSSATEALTESEQGKKYTAPKTADIKECIADADRAQAREKAVSGKSRLMMQETNKNILFETQDTSGAGLGAWVHRNYMTK
jgi:hypothetical protein